MNYEAFPFIKLEIENMKHSIIAHMGIHNSELGDRLSEEIDKAIENYPWQEKVTQVVHSALNQQIENYFKYGVGRAVIAQAVDESFKEAFKK